MTSNRNTALGNKIFVKFKSNIETSSTYILRTESFYSILTVTYRPLWTNVRIRICRWLWIFIHEPIEMWRYCRYISLWMLDASYRCVASKWFSLLFHHLIKLTVVQFIYEKYNEVWQWIDSLVEKWIWISYADFTLAYLFTLT